jgi:hypothetical protein
MTHEPRITMIQSTQALRLHHPCGVCGMPDAPFGKGCALLKYLRQKERGLTPDKKLLGQWRCKEHLDA